MDEEKEIRELYEEMMKKYGKENVPNPNQYPIRFEFMVKSFLYQRENRTKVVKR